MLPTPLGFDRVPVIKVSARHGMRRSHTIVITEPSVNAKTSQTNSLFSLRNVDRFTQRSRRSFHNVAIQNLHQHLTNVRTRSNVYSQRNFSVFRPESPYNAVDVATQLKALNYEGKYDEVKRLFETGKYQANDQAVEAYKEALSNLQAGNHSKSFSESNASTASAADSNFQSANTEAAAATEAMPNMNQSSGTNPNFSTPDYNQWYQLQYQYYTTQAQVQSRMLEMMQKPIPVAVESTVAQPTARYSWFKIVGGVVFGVMVGVVGGIFLLSGSRTKDSEEGDDKPTGGSQGGKADFPMGGCHASIKSVVEKFDDVKGVDEAKEELKEVVDYLKNPEKYTKLGAKLPKGVLLMGEPGTGKTLLARAVAGEAGVPFFYASGSSFDELYVGVGPKRVRMMFEDAKKVNGPCIIFIDEIDALGTSRQRIMSSSYARESTLNQLLTEMDGFKQNKGIIVIGATNFPDILDAALIRPGRFDKQVMVSKPDKQGRKEIMDLYLKKTVFKDIDSDVIARGTPGFTGADLSNLINLAAMKASRKDKKAIDMRDIEDAKDDVLMGIKKSRPIDTLEDRKMTAYHEAGHAIVAMLTPGCDPVHKVTIMPRGAALGVTSMLPERDQYTMSRKQALARITMAMGGRVAEELIFGEDGISSGASSDFYSATNTAARMVTEWGMSPKVGFISFRNKEKGIFSEDQRRIVDEEIRRILDTQYQHARNLLKENERVLHKMAEELLQEETLSGDRVKLILQSFKTKDGDNKLDEKRGKPSDKAPSV